MIIVQIPETYNHISQELYNDLTTYEKLDHYFLGTKFENYSFHGHYQRTVIDDYGNEIELDILRIRITIDNDDDSSHIETHAVFFSCMMPFLKYSVSDVISIANDDIVDTLTISTSVYYFLKQLFKGVTKENIYSLIKNVYKFIRIHIISTQHMKNSLFMSSMIGS